MKRFFEAKRLRPYKTCATMMDLRGRTIRTGRFAQPEGVHVQVNDCVEFRTDGLEIESTKEEIQISFYDLPPVMREGDLISFGDNG